MSVQGVCVSNDDFKNEIWPRSFVAVPNKGDMVEARGGRRMEVCRVTHMMGRDVCSSDDSATRATHYPYIKVELKRIS